MKLSFPHLPLSVFLALGISASLGHGQNINLINQVDVTNGAEIVAFSPDGDTVATNVTDTAPNIGAQLFTLGGDGSLAAREFVSVSTEFGGAIASVSSVALDPLGRGFGVMSVIPTASGTTAGIVVFFDYRSATAGALKTLTVGFHPDSVVFSRDGSKVFVANEGEFTTGGDTDAPGSVSVVDLSAVAAIGDLAGLDAGDVTTVDFSPGNLDTGVTLDDLRFNDSTFTSGNEFRHVEPEYITEGDGKLFVTLQENNAVAEFTLTGPNAFEYTNLFPLGTIEQTIDASDRDGAGGSTAALVDDVVKGAPMPDTIASYVVGGTRYFITANEGDFRPDDDDRIRVKDFSGTEMGVTIDTSDAGLGRLRVLKDLSDPDNNDLIDEVIMPGTRSFSIWDAETGALVGDTGSLESLLLGLFPDLHNINGEDGDDTFDDRSDDKGPEPEAITYGRVGSNHYVFVGMERQGAILMFNVNDPAHPVFVAAIDNVSDGLVAPECLVFVSAANSPTDNPLLLAGYEVGGKIGVYSLTDSPKIKAPAKVKAGSKTKNVTLKGRSSEGTILIEVDGKRARGRTSWTAKVPFPLNKKRVRVEVSATSAFGDTATKKVTIVRERSGLFFRFPRIPAPAGPLPAGVF